MLGTAGTMGSMPNSRSLMPFTALVGQETMKTALVLNAINPGIGGVLIRGQRGTAKSTAVRALARLLPEIDVIAGCRYRCDPALPGELVRRLSPPLRGRRWLRRSSAGAPGSSSCRSTPPRIEWSGPSTPRPRSSSASVASSPGCSPTPTAASSTSTRSTCSTTTSSMCFSTRPRWAGMPSSARASRSRTRRDSSWWGR